MKHFLYFIKEFVRTPRTIGSIIPSSRTLAKQMILPINFSTTNCIIEYGRGTGIFTEQLIQHKKEETVLLLLESNKECYDILQQRYRHIKNIYIVHDSAEYVQNYIQRYGIEKVDYIVSGVPFACLSTAEILQGKGVFITFQYTQLKLEMFRSFFASINKKRVVLNFPPAYVFSCQL
ncbi:SAM-dependent methyltransferase [Bacillus sp. 165]|uniref:class I SAM-dependent methyltransferase n=1 Tax=Bacillus sp. 165 TaxID=1529117 RepID=UPI0032AF118C